MKNIFKDMYNYFFPSISTKEIDTKIIDTNLYCENCGSVILYSGINKKHYCNNKKCNGYDIKNIKNNSVNI